MQTSLNHFDDWLISHSPNPNLKSFKRFIYEFIFFGLKNARACLFAGLIFGMMLIVPRAGIFGIPRYDLLLIFALFVQFLMFKLKLETLDEIKAITLFGIVDKIESISPTY